MIIVRRERRMEREMSKSNLPSTNVDYSSQGYEPVEEKEEHTSPLTEEYYELPLSLGARKRFCSLASLILGALSILLCFLYYVSIPLAILAVIFAFVSRKNFGFFDKITLIGIIFGLVGAVFGISALVLDLVGVLDLVRK